MANPAVVDPAYRPMDGEIDWRAIEDSCPENRQLAEVVRWLERVCGRDPSLDGPETRRRRAEALAAFLASSAESRELTARLHGADFIVGGDEHWVIRVEDEPERVFKVTHGDAFGCYAFFSPHDPDLTGKHFHGSINEDPIRYLRRWMLLNSFSDYVTRFEGLLPPEDGLRMARICVSQPALDGPNPSRDRIRQCLAEYGFSWVSEDAFVHLDARILLTDAAPRNVRIVGDRIALFDAIASLATAEILAWAQAGPLR